MGSNPEISMKDLKRVPMFWLGLAGQALVFGGSAFGAPILALHLASFEGFTKGWIGFYFATPAITYVLNSVFVAWYCKIMSRKKVIFIGSLLFTLSMYMIGTSPLLGFESNYQTIHLGLALLGFGIGMVAIPVIPETLDCITMQFPHLESEELNNVIAGYFNSSLGVGEAVAPLSAGVLVEAFGYRRGVDVAATVLLVYTVMFFLLGGGFALLMPEKTNQDSRIDAIDDNYIRIKEDATSKVPKSPLPAY